MQRSALTFLLAGLVVSVTGCGGTGDPSETPDTPTESATPTQAPTPTAEPGTPTAVPPTPTAIPETPTPTVADTPTPTGDTPTPTGDTPTPTGETPTPTSGTPLPGGPALFFSEYIEGSSNNKAVEIFNAGPGAADLSLYEVAKTVNGGTFEAENVNHIPLTGTLAEGDVFVIANSSADAAILAVADLETSDLNHNGNDAVALFKGDVIVDQIGFAAGEDPGAGWPVAGIANATKDASLWRQPTVMAGNGGDWATSTGTDVASSEWAILSRNTFSDLGQHATGDAYPRAIVTMRVTAPSGSPGPLHVTGNHPMLGTFDSVGITLDPEGANVWSTTLDVVEGMDIAYKYTRGDRDSAEAAEGGGQLDDRLATLTDGLVIEDVIAEWSDDPTLRTWASVYPIFTANCSTCHVGGSSGGMSISETEADAYDDIVNVPANGLSSMDRIEPGSPDASYILYKVMGSQASVGGSGSQMPLGGQLSEEDIATLVDWVTVGAPF